ncbi:MAG: sodium:solute symporter family protein, partial [Bacteroidales bacterium]|nr:sodium:solute symporter family protein [Bacteroidales bacterium]
MHITTLLHIIGIVVSVATIEIIGITSGKKIKNHADWSHAGGKANSWICGGIILGTLIGGQSTIGTSQLAFSFGFSALWFTFGAAMGCLLLAFPYTKALRNSGCTTVTEVIRTAYGDKIEVLSSLLCCLGIFLSIVAQNLSLSAIITTLFPCNFYVASLLSACAMLCFVLFGGAWSAGLGGMVKMTLLLLTSLFGGLVVLILSNGFKELMTNVEHIMQLTQNAEQFNTLYHNPFARGINKDLGSALSVVLGVVCTQSYAQGIWAARDTATARKGTLLSAIMAILVGLACSFIGLFMRGHYITTTEQVSININSPFIYSVIDNTAQAFPLFAIHHMPALLGGIMLGTIIITAIVGGAGLTLGATTILTRDVVGRFFPKLVTEKRTLQTQRFITFALLFLASLAALFTQGSFINDLGFLSMGLRVATVFFPLTATLFFKERINKKWMATAITLSTIALIITKITAF